MRPRAKSPAEPLEREVELATLRARLDAAADGGQGTVVAIVSAAGTGKTALLDALATEARPRAEVLAARAVEVERELPCAVVRQLVERPLLALDPHARDALLAPPATPVRVLLDGPVDAPVESATALAHGLYWVLARLADRRPLCVVVDDLHWADAPSAAALAYVARRVEGHPLLLVTGAREDEPGAGSRRDLLGEPDVLVLRPEPLSVAAATRLAERELGAGGDAVDPAFAAACHRATGGNPRLLVELLGACAADGVPPDAAGAERVRALAPERIARMALDRIARLGDEAVAVARAVAILERAAPVDAAALAELDEAACATAADRLIMAGVLADEIPLRFAHPMTGASVAGELTSAARDRAHRRAAALLAPRDQAAAAVHLLRCAPGGERWAADVLHGAARAALAGGDPPAAVGLLDRALAEGGGDAHAAIAGTLLAAGDPRAVAHLQEALRRSADPADRLRVTALLAKAQFTTGDPRGCFATLRDALPDAHVLGAGGDALADLVVTAALLGQHDPVLRARAAALAGELTDDPRLTAVETVHAFCLGEPGEAAVARATPQLGPLAASGATDVAPAFHMLVWALAGLDAVRPATAALDEAFALARERGSRLRYGMACYLRSWVRWRSGDVVGTLADVEETLTFAVEGGAIAEADVRWVQGECLLLSGDLDGAEQALASGLVAAERVGWLLAEAWLRHGRAGLRLRTGDAAGALDDALAAGERFVALGIPSPAVADWRGRAVRAALRLGEDSRARELAEESVRLARVVGTPRTLALALRAQALTRTGQARVDGLRAAEAQAARCPSPVVHATVLQELGSALRRDRHAREAREPLTRAVDLARRAGAPALAEDAAAELEATGARRRPAGWGPDSLTPREHELAALAAAGLTNTQIAERLFITRKTVESHLMSVFRKLGVQSREQLATRNDPGAVASTSPDRA